MQAIVVTQEFLLPYFDRPLQDAAAKLGVCCTTMKKICRKLGIDRWPNTSRPSRGSQTRRQPSPRRTLTSSPPGSADETEQDSRPKEEEASDCSSPKSSDIAESHNGKEPVRRDMSLKQELDSRTSDSMYQRWNREEFSGSSSSASGAPASSDSHVLKRELDHKISVNMQLHSYWQAEDAAGSSSFASGAAASIDAAVMELEASHLVPGAHAQLTHAAEQPGPAAAPLQHAAGRAPMHPICPETLYNRPDPSQGGSVEGSQERLDSMSAFWREDPFQVMDTMFRPAGTAIPGDRKSVV